MIPLLALSLVAIAVLAVLLVRKERQVESILRASELARKEQTAAHARQIADLTARIQAPELVPTLSAPEPTGEVLHVPLDDDAAHDDYMRQRATGEVA